MKEAFQKFWHDEDGATAIEYGLIAGLIAVVIIAAVTALGGNIKAVFCEIAAKVGVGLTGATTCSAA